MDLNWASPWEEETNKSPNTPLSPLQAAVLAPSRDDHAAPWGIVQRGRFEWASTIPNEWTDGNVERERSFSETSAWGISDDSRRGGEDRQTLVGPKSLSLSVPVPARQSSPDPWATAVSINNGRIRVEDGSVGLKEKENVNPAQSIIPQPALTSTPDDIHGVLGESAVSEKAIEISTLELPHNQSVATVGDDATSSRPSSSLSHHRDDLTESSRTSFEQEPSKVKKLVSHFDRSATEIEETPVVIGPESLSENKTSKQAKNSELETAEPEVDDFGDFEEETQGSNFDTFEILPSQNDRARPNLLSKNSDPHFKVDLQLLNSFLSDICSISSESESQGTNEDVFTTIEERKLWHRVSRYGTMRKHDSGNDDNYKRVKWGNSKIRDETLRVVSRWRTEDSFNGGVILGGGNRGSMFGWDDKKMRNSGPINMSEIWAERSAKHRSIPASSTTSLNSPLAIVSLPTDPKSPGEPIAKFGWSTLDPKIVEKSNNPIQITSPSLFSLAPPPPSSLASPTPQDSRTESVMRPTSVDLSRHPRVATLRGLGHKSTMSLDRNLPDPVESCKPQNTSEVISSPVVPHTMLSTPPSKELRPLEPLDSSSRADEDDDDDDWGDMVTPELDAAFIIPDRDTSESHKSRNRADSAPHITPLERVSQPKRPISMQVGVLPTSATTDLVGLSKIVPNLGELESQTAPQPEAPIVAKFSLQIIETLAPSSNHFPAMPKLCAINDDFDAWGDALISSMSKKIDSVERPASILVHPSPQPSDITMDDFNTWDSFDDFIQNTSEKDSHLATTSIASKSLEQDPPPVPTRVTNEIDGWAGADFSIFEKVLAPAHTAVASSSKEELPKTGMLFEGDSTAPDVRSSFSLEESEERSEEDRIVKSIVSKLPDLSYMFTR